VHTATIILGSSRIYVFTSAVFHIIILPVRVSDFVNRLSFIDTVYGLLNKVVYF
jgi:hypothetical protein